MRTNEDRDKAIDDVLDPVMETLRREHKAVTAPGYLSSLLMAETRRAAPPRRSGQDRRRFGMAWAWGASLLVLAGVVWGLAARERHRTEISLPKAVRSGPHSAVPDSTVPPSLAATTEATKPERTVRPIPNEEPERSLDDFLPLPASEGLPPTSAVSLVRMRIATGALQQYGLDVPEGAASETLLAEFVVGEDGLPRAIRIIP